MRSSSFGLLAFYRGTCTDISVIRFALSNGTSAIVDTAKLPGASDSDNHALRRTRQSRALLSTFAANFFRTGSIKVYKNPIKLAFRYTLQ